MRLISNGYKIARLGVVSLAVAISHPLIVLAQEGHAHTEHHAPTISDLTLYFINFAIYVVIVALVCRKKIPVAWAARRERVRTQMELWRSKILAAEKHLAEARGKLAIVATEAKKIEQNIQRDSEHESNEMIEAAKRSAARIVSQAKDSVAAERKFAESVLRRMYAELAVKLAEEKLRREITPDRDSKLRERTQKEISRLLN